MRAATSSSICLAADPRIPSGPAAVLPRDKAGYTTASAGSVIVVRNPLQGGGGPYTSFCSSSRAPIRRTTASSLGKMPTTSLRRLISPLRRSSGLVSGMPLRAFRRVGCEAGALRIKCTRQRCQVVHNTLVMAAFSPFSRAISSRCSEAMRSSSASFANKLPTRFLSCPGDRPSRLSGGITHSWNPIRPSRRKHKMRLCPGFCTSSPSAAGSRFRADSHPGHEPENQSYPWFSQ